MCVVSSILFIKLNSWSWKPACIPHEVILEINFLHDHYLSVVDLFTWMPYLINKKLVRAGWIWRKYDSLTVSSICGYKALEGERVNMYRTIHILWKKSSQSNKRKNFFSARWPRWGQYRYWHWYCQVHVLHDDNLIKMCWWQKAYQTQNVLLHRLVCLTKVTPIFFHKATANFVSGLAKFYVDSKDCEV